MNLAQPKETQLDDALAQLRSAGGPVPVTRSGETVAMLLTPEELERLEDERDAAILREAQLRGPKEDAVSIEDFANELGVDLEALAQAYPPPSSAGE